MKLNDLRDNEGARKKRMIVGRGIGSGKGKQCGRGGKGQTARSGVRLGGFGGGQMPLIRRIPKRGFNNIFASEYAEINISRLQEAINAKRLDATKVITYEVLAAAGLIKEAADGVRVLGNGTLTAKIQLSVAGATKSALAAVEKAGGSVTVLKKAKAEEKTA